MPNENEAARRAEPSTQSTPVTSKATGENHERLKELLAIRVEYICEECAEVSMVKAYFLGPRLEAFFWLKAHSDHLDKVVRL